MSHAFAVRRSSGPLGWWNHHHRWRRRQRL